MASLVGGALAATVRGQQPLPSFRSGIDVVRLDISVLDKDRRPIKNLTAADFTITVDGTTQPIVAFEPIVLPPREAPTAQWMRNVAPDVKTNALGEPRLFVIVMDDAQTPFDPYMVNSGKSIGRAIVEQMDPSDLAAVVFTKDNRGAQDFTSDRALMLAAIESFHAGWMPELLEIPGRMSMGVVRNAITFLRARPHGRNAIMLISVGGGIVDEPDFTSRSDSAGLLGGAGDEAAVREREAYELRMATRAGLIALSQDAALARIPIYGFSIAGLMAEGQATVNTAAPPELRAPRFTPRSAIGGNDALRTLADVSGGRAIVDNNEPARLVPAVFEENSAYYIIGYKATYGLADGRSHRLKIAVARPGAIVFPSDRQLLSAKPAAAKTAAPPPPLVRAISELVPRSDLPMAVVTAPFAFPMTRDPKAATTGILATLRVSRPAPAERTTEQIQVLAKVFTPEGKELAGVHQNAEVKLRPSASDAEFDILTPIGLKPGRYNVRLSAHSVGLDRTGSVYTDVIVPDFSKEKLSLSGVVVSADPTLVAAPRDALASIIPVVPTSRRDFERGDRATAFLRIYRSRKESQTVEITARVTDANGREVTSERASLGAERFTGPHRSADFSYQLPLQRIRPGAHLLTIEATAAGATARRDIRFSVR